MQHTSADFIYLSFFLYKPRCEEASYIYLQSTHDFHIFIPSEEHDLNQQLDQMEALA